MVLILGFGFVIADDTTGITDEIATAEDYVIAGTTPDQAFYGFELAFEGVTEAFSEKARIAHMKERVAEAKVMMYEGNINESIRAINRFERIRKKLNNQNRMNEHHQFMNNLGQQVSAIARQGNVTESDRAMIKELIQEHKGRIKNESIEIISEDKGITIEEASGLLEQKQQKTKNKVTFQMQERMNEVKNGRLQS